MTNNAEQQRSRNDYTIACICPMGVELAPVEAMLDEIHSPLPASRDQNAYTLGKIDKHNVVIAVMPGTGNNTAATTATQLLNDFPSIRFGLLVGIGGGVPGEADVRLGDVVVSQPIATFGGVVQYDLGKSQEGGQFQRTGLLNKPPSVLSANVRKLESQHRRRGHNLQQHISEALIRNPEMEAEYSFPATEQDRLFLSTYLHQPGPTCAGCDSKYVISRPDRASNKPKIHYGTIGSANVVVKDALLRDNLYNDLQILCVEMEAAGLMNDFPCLVIRGICDYADSHKNDKWQPYAAAVAAAYARDLLLIIPNQEVTQIGRARETTVSHTLQYDNGTHSWALDLGAQLARYDLLQNQYEDSEIPGITSERRNLVKSMNDKLRQHNIFFVVPNIVPGQEVQHFDGDILDLVGVGAGWAHAAFVLIGFAGYLLNMAHGIENPSSAAELKSLARNRILSIPVLCTGIDIDPVALFGSLEATSTAPLALRAFLRHAQLTMS